MRPASSRSLRVAGEVEARPETPVPAEPAVADNALSRRQQMSTAVDDLAETLGIDRNSVQILRGGSVQWPSNALGCPELGKSYLDVMTPGSWFVLGVENQVYHYHAAEGGKPFHCPDGRRQAPPSIGRLD